MKIKREPLDSQRLKVINFQTGELHEGVASLNESLVDKDREDCVGLIESIRTKLNILKDQIVNGDIIQ